MASRRANVFRNGPRNGSQGKVILLPETFEELLQVATAKLQLPTLAKRIFNEKGAEITDMDVIRDEDTLFVSEGDDEFKTISETADPGDEWVTLNVGGRHFTTTRSTLTRKEPESMLGRMFAQDSQLAASPRDAQGAYLIDRSPEYFEPIIGWLRHGDLVLNEGVNPRGVLEEVRFYGIQSLEQVLNKIVEKEAISDLELSLKPLTRRDVINALIATPCTSELRFQGVNLSGADLSKLDLRYINFKYSLLRGANLQGANLSYSTLERADISGSCLDGAVLFGVKMVCANLRESSLKNVNCEDPMSVRTNMEGVNLKSANLEGSQLAHVNLRVATLKNAVLCNCDLRGAILAGADLEDCDLSGSDLHEANLRGANLKGATFELMMTPLHMAQAIGR